MGHTQSQKCITRRTERFVLPTLNFSVATNKQLGDIFTTTSVGYTNHLFYSPQSDDEETPRVVALPFHSTGASSARAYPVFKQQSATSGSRVAPNAPKFLSHAQPSSSAPHSNHATRSSSGSLPYGAQPPQAPHSNHATQSSSGSLPYGAQPPQAPHHEQPSSQSHPSHDGNIRSGNTRNITSTNLRVMGTDDIDDTHNPNDNTTNSDDHGNASDASNTNVGVRQRSSLNKTAPDATQLRFYSGCWVDVLKDAKYQY